MKREFIFILTSLMLIGLLGTASMSLGIGTWTQKADMPTARSSSGTAVVDGKIYVIGGVVPENVPSQWGATTTAVEEYDPTTDTWTKKADMPTSRNCPGTAVVNGIIYVIGGWSEGSFFSVVEAYDPVADEWSRKANMPTPRQTYAFAVDGKIYAIGGLTSGVGLGARAWAAVEVYDPATDTWTRKADMPTARERHGACVVDGRIYVFGGGATHPIEVALKTVEVYDPATDTWTQASDMPRRWMGHTASAVDGKIYIIGGQDIVYVYDPATDTWTTAADPLPTPRVYLTAAVVDGRIYAIGGWQGGLQLSTVEEYDPGLPESLSTASPAGKQLETWGQVKKIQ